VSYKGVWMKLQRYRSIIFCLMDLGCYWSVDALNLDLKEQLEVVSELSNNDISKKLIHNNNEIQIMRRTLNEKEREVVQLKKALGDKSSQYSNEGSHFKSFLEKQSKELAQARRLVEEYEGREKTCSRKWNSLLQENLLNVEKVNQLKQQLQRQKDTYQNAISISDKKLIEAQTQIPFILQRFGEEKKAAAQLLIVQIQISNEEKQNLLRDNEILHMKIQDLGEENMKLKTEFQSIHYLNVNDAQELSFSQKLQSRIEELEDLVHEMKQQGGVGRIVELEQHIQSQQHELSKKVVKIEELSKHMKEMLKRKEGGEFDQEHVLDYFGKIIKDKDEYIAELKKETLQIRSRGEQHTYPKAAPDNDEHYRESVGKQKRIHFSNMIRVNDQDQMRQEWLSQDNEPETYNAYSS